MVTRLQYAVDDRLTTDSLRAVLREALTGSQHTAQPEVLWENRGAQVLMLVETLAVHLLEDTIVVAIDTETEEFGVAPLIVRFHLGSGRDPAGLVASTDARVLGHMQLAARWGNLYRAVLWSALLRLVDLHASERGLQAKAISVLGDHVRITAAPRLALRELAKGQLEVDGSAGPQ